MKIDSLMRVMAIDYGDSRTGVAVSDLSATIVGDAWVIHEKNQTKVLLTVASEAAARNVGTIVIGHPRNMNGTIGPRARKSEQIAELLRELSSFDVVLWDERMTTVSAFRVLDDVGRHGKERKNAVDAVAASLILESYLQFLISGKGK